MQSTTQITGLTTWLMALPLLAFGHRYITRETTFYKVDGKSLSGNVTAVMHVKDFFDCSFLCIGYGPVTCLSFNLERSNNSVRTCELSGSEKYLEPQKIEGRSGYDYYGTKFKSLIRIHPCVSSPCNFGGTCTEGPGLGEYSCQCKPEVSVLPFVDNRCNVDTSKMFFASIPTQGVFWGRGVTTYNLNYQNAKRFCDLLGATLATYNQLRTAWQAGLERCAYGWLADETLRFPMRSVKSGCGNKIAIIGSSGKSNKSIKKDAWCFKQT